MSVSVIPSYRVMLHLARRAGSLGYAEALDSMENGMRDYVRTQLAQIHSSLVELGVRSVIGQLGDPELDQLRKTLVELDDSRPQEVARQALEMRPGPFPGPTCPPECSSSRGTVRAPSWSISSEARWASASEPALHCCSYGPVATGVKIFATT